MATQTSGTLIGSVLESVGYHYQGVLLDALAQPFQSDLGGLLYLVGIAVAVFHAAIQGQFKFAPWLLIGPPIFFAVVLVREPINNTRWEFGGDGRNQAAVTNQVNQLLASQGAAAGGQARVSKLFSRYTQLIAKSSGEIVKVINDGRLKTDLWFVMKAELFARIHTKTPDRPATLRLVYHAMGQQCGRAIELAYRMSDPLRPQIGQGTQPVDAVRADARNRFDEMVRQRNVSLDPVVLRWLAERQLGPGNHPEATIDQRFAELKRTNQFTCLEIWDMVRQALIEEAQTQFERLAQDARINGINRDQFIDFLNQSHGGAGGRLGAGQDPAALASNVTRIVRIMAKYLLRNAMQETGRGAFIEQLAEKQETTNVQVEAESRNSTVERARLGAREWAEKARLAAALTNIPYYQGLALYFLGVTFPFFAMLLLIPGKHAGFILWFLLWLWIKTWDIALAMVMLLDDVLFSMMAIGRQRGRPEQPIPEAFDAAIRALREVDPSFQLATYYSLISIAVISIPVITAQFVLGSLKGGAGLISQGVNRFSGTFVDGALSRHQQVAISNLRFMAMSNRLNFARDYLQSIQKGNARESGKGMDNFEVPKMRLGQRSQPGVAERTANGNNYAMDGLEARGNRIRWVSFGSGVARGFGEPRNAMSPMVDLGNAASGGRFGGSKAGRGSTSPSGADGSMRWKPSKGDQIFGVIEAVSAGAGDMGNKYVDTQRRNYQREIDLQAGWALWDSAHSRRERELMGLAAVYGQIQVPWMNFATPGWNSEFEKEVTEFENRWDLIAQAIETSGKVVSSSIDATRSTPHTPTPEVTGWRKYMGTGGARNSLTMAAVLTGMLIGEDEGAKARTEDRMNAPTPEENYAQRLMKAYEKASGNDLPEAKHP